MSILSKGRRVHYVHHVDCYLADVVKVWSDDMINVVITMDGTNDFLLGGTASNLHLWRTSVKRDDEKSSGTWHWPEREGD